MTIDRRRFLAGAGLATAAGALAATGPSPFTADDARGWRAVREQFELTPDYVHLGLFFITSHPRPVREAIERHRRGMDKNPLLYAGGHMHLEAEAQKAAADYLGAEAGEVALTDSTTMGLATVYHGLPLRAGQEILTTTHDHYATHESARLAAERVGATVRKIPLFDGFDSVSEDEIVGRIRRAVTPRTRAVGVTWVHSSSGVKLPLRAIAAALAEAHRGRAEEDRAFLIVDGVHGFGVEDEQAARTGCDFFVAGCHKWMFGPRGTGVVWAKRETWRLMRPTIPAFHGGPVAAWMRGETPPQEETDASWMTPGGFHSFEHRWALAEAFAFHKQLGRARVAARIHALNDQCKEGLARIPRVKLYTPRGSNLSAGLVCFDIEGLQPAEVVDRLLKRRILATTTPYAHSYARLAPSLLNTTEEIETTLKEIRALAS